MKNSSPVALPPPPPVIPSDFLPAKVNESNRRPMARRGYGTKGQKIPLLTNHFNVKLSRTNDHFFQYSVHISSTLFFYSHPTIFHNVHPSFTHLKHLFRLHYFTKMVILLKQKESVEKFSIWSTKHTNLKWVVKVSLMMVKRLCSQSAPYLQLSLSSPSFWRMLLPIGKQYLTFCSLIDPFKNLKSSFCFYRTIRGGSPSEGETKRSRRVPQSKQYKVTLSYATKIPIQAIFNALQGQDSVQFHEAGRVLDVMLRQHAAKQ